MVELKIGPRTVDLPYTLYVQGVTEKMFDELVSEDTKAELLDGVMIMHSPASPRHDDVSGFLRSVMRMYTAARHLGKVLGPDTLIHLATCRKFAPDLFFLDRRRVPRRLPRKQFEGAPDYIGEVLSPSNRSDGLDDKRPAYRQARVKEMWFVDLEGEEVVIDRLVRRHYETQVVTTGRIEPAVIAGFWIEAAWLWAELLPNEMACLQEILG